MNCSVLFVCMGNICRSPAAEAVFRLVAESLPESISLEIDSAGTIDFHHGKPADSRMQAAAAALGLELTSRARQVQAEDLQRFDWVIAMDRENLEYLQELPRAESCRLHLLSDFLGDDWPTDVPDPYYGGDDGFAYVLEMLFAAMPRLLQAIESEFPGASPEDDLAAENLCEVYSAANIVEAELLAAKLRQAGLNARVVGHYLQNAVGDLPAVAIAPRIWVLESQEAKARKLLQAYERAQAQQPGPPSNWKCSNCQETNDSSFDLCWNCQTPYLG